MLKRRLWWVAAALLALAGCDDPADPVDGGGTDGGHQTMDDGGTCAGIADSCTAAGTSCDGTTLVTCAANADGCLVATTMSCSAIGEICDDSGAEAKCAEDVDVCEGIPAADRCETEDARACNEDTLEVCAMNAAGCLVLERTDCGAAEGGFCDESGTMPVCVAPVDPCASIPSDERCTAEGTSCDGDSLVTCAPDAFGCLIETATDCSTATDGTCEGTPAMCTFTGDACEGVTECDAAGTSCDGPDLVECAPDAFGCLVETRTTCTDVMFGFCDADAATPMCSTAALDPCMGETQCGTEITRACNGDNTGVESCVPNAFGCFVVETTACAAREVCSEDSGTAVCGPADPNCPAAEAMVLDCASGTVSGDTAMGAANITNYECTTLGYPGNDQIWRFENADRAVVTIRSTRLSGSGDFDLTVLEGASGAMCDSGLTCLDRSSGTSATETVEFVSVPGATNYVVYDLYGTTITTTDYTLEVTCEPIVCGDGVLTGDETCEDGNTASGDGCSDICQVEPGYECETLGSACVFVCGDGVLDSSESCDDGNTTPGDGCSATCEIEPGYNCIGAGADSCFALAANGVCATATAITGTSSFTGENIDAGGPRPQGSGCGTSAGNNALYYAVTIPPMTAVNVTTAGTFDRVLLVQDSCGATSCSYRTDSSPERALLRNDGSADITQIVAIHNYYASGSGTFDIDFTYQPIPMNASCAGARQITGTASFTGEPMALGGPKPSGSGCGGGSGSTTLYYEVTIPPNTRVVANADEGPDPDTIIFVQNACSDVDCVDYSDSPEIVELVNTGTADITQIVGVRPWGTSTTPFDISFTYLPASVPNEVCAGATPLTGSLTGENLWTGGPRPTGSNCGSSTGRVLYYSVNVPANSTATVTATPTGSTSWNLTLRSLADCSGDCLGNVNAGSNGVAETIGLVNLTGADETYLVAVGANSSTTIGTFDIEVTTAAITYAANATCAGATPLVAGTPIAGEDTAVGGVAPTGTTCDTTGAQTLYYEVTVPAGQIGTVVVEPASGFDVAVMALDSCGAADCSARVDGYAGGGDETLTIDNLGGTTDITKVVAVNASAAGGAGTFGIELTLETPAYVVLPFTAACVTGGTWDSPTRSGTGNDETTSLLTLPFAFSYFGDAVTHYSMSTNGYAQLFTSSAGVPEDEWSNGRMPNAAEPNGIVAAFWDDLYLGSAFDIRTQTVGSAGSQTLVIEWLDAKAGSTGGLMTMQIHLHEGTNVIEYHYCSVSTGGRESGNSATIGLENTTGDDAITYSYNTANAVTNGGGLRFTPN